MSRPLFYFKTLAPLEFRLYTRDTHIELGRKTVPTGTFCVSRSSCATAKGLGNEPSILLRLPDNFQWMALARAGEFESKVPLEILAEET